MDASSELATLDLEITCDDSSSLLLVEHVQQKNKIHLTINTPFNKYKIFFFNFWKAVELLLQHRHILRHLEFLEQLIPRTERESELFLYFSLSLRSSRYIGHFVHYISMCTTEIYRLFSN